MASSARSFVRIRGKAKILLMTLWKLILSSLNHSHNTRIEHSFLSIEWKRFNPWEINMAIEIRKRFMDAIGVDKRPANTKFTSSKSSIGNYIYRNFKSINFLLLVNWFYTKNSTTKNNELELWRTYLFNLLNHLLNSNFLLRGRLEHVTLQILTSSWELAER